MTKTSGRLLIGAVVLAAAARPSPVPDLFAQDIDPFPKPIAQNGEAARVNIAEFASIPDSNGEAARLMLLATAPRARPPDPRPERLRRAPDAPGQRAGHAPPVRQRHERAALQRQLRRQVGRQV